MKRWHPILNWLVVSLFLGSCALPAWPSPQQGTLRILAGSEIQPLQSLIDQFAQQQQIRVDVTYRGSVDIMQELSRDELPYDVVWPANSLWLELGDTKRRARHEKSIMRSPVVLGVKESVAHRFGWVNAPVPVSAILAQAEAGQLRFIMGSASQTDAGATAYLGYLYAFAGNPEVLTVDHLRASEVQDQIKRILGSVSRSSGGSMALKELFLSEYDQFDAMVNYEALIIEMNQQLLRDGREPLRAIYPADGLAIADAPLAYVGPDEPGREELFRKLQEYLLSPAAQGEILGRGWRVGLLELEPQKADVGVFNPAWGVGVDRQLTPIRFPRESVIRTALHLYQTVFRKPSFTIWCLDFSGSMKGTGEQQLKEAMRMLLDQERASQYILQAGPDDINVIIAFDDGMIAEWFVQGNDAAKLGELASQIDATRTDGGTNIYAPIVRSLAILKERGVGDRLPAIVLMTDGQSNEGSLDDVRRQREQLGMHGVPVHAILFGGASHAQLEAIAHLTSGQIFDGRSNLVDAFRAVKGYN